MLVRKSRLIAPFLSKSTNEHRVKLKDNALSFYRINFHNFIRFYNHKIFLFNQKLIKKTIYYS